MRLKREYPTLPIVGVGILIQDDEKYLLIKRAAEPDRGLWSVPGGLIEIGEKSTDAATREALEETGLTVEIKERLGVVDKIEYDENGKVLYHFIIIQFLAVPIEGTLNPMDDALEAVWVKRYELKNFNLTKSLEKFLKEIGLFSD
jgi:8-oxo-dGTP diphosphatase